MQILSPSSVLLRTQSDERLVVLARAGHERAFEAIVERYRGPLLRAARRYLPEARAEDALQQAYLSAWTALRRGDEVRDLRAWLYRIVHNMALNQLRISGYDYAELEESLRGSDAPQEEMERRAIVRQTLTGLAALPERQREALLRIAVEGRSQEEVARELGVSEGAVRQLVHRARLTLRAAATAVTPLPLATWAAGAAGATGAVSSQMTERIAELVGGAGASAFLAKAGAVAVLATGTAVAVPAIAPSGADPQPRPKVERTATPSASPERRPAAASASATAAAAAAPAATVERKRERVRTAVEPHRAGEIREAPRRRTAVVPAKDRVTSRSAPSADDSPGSSRSGSDSSNAGTGPSGSGSGPS